MPYWKRKVKPGKTIEVKKYYSRVHKTKESRLEKKNLTTEQQEQVNIRQTIEHLRWLLNENFREGDAHVEFTFKLECRPDTYDELVKYKDKLIKKLRREYRKQGKELKYVYVLEAGKRGAFHIHMVINDVNLRTLKDCWPYGRIFTSTLDETGQYGKLASYLIKEKGKKKVENYGGKAYSPSRNLKRPEVEKKVIWNRDFYKEDPEPEPGYYIDKESINRGLTKDGYPFLEYILVKIESQPQPG